jgi:hypothetical protein
VSTVAARFLQTLDFVFECVNQRYQLSIVLAWAQANLGKLEFTMRFSRLSLQRLIECLKFTYLSIFLGHFKVNLLSFALQLQILCFFTALACLI